MKLKAYRKQQGLTRAEAARQLDVSWITLWRWETDRQKPEFETMKRIMKWSRGQVTPNDLLGVKAS